MNVFLILFKFLIGSGVANSFLPVAKLIISTQMSPSQISCAAVSIEPRRDFQQGSVLIAKANEANNWFSKAAILIYEKGYNNTYGVILERPSAFKVGDAAPGMSVFASNTLYLGGETGEDTALLFHTFNLGGTCKLVSPGLYVGGVGRAKAMVEAREAMPSDFKLVFNRVTWGRGELERECSNNRWDIVSVMPDLIIHQCGLWAMARAVLDNADTTQVK